MQNREQVEAKLRQETRDQIFNRQLAEVIAQKQKERIDSVNKTYAEQVDASKYTHAKLNLGQDPPSYKIQGDNKFKTKKWEAMMSDCAFYFDRPSIAEESAMKKTLMTKYDDLFPGVAMKPVLQSRKDLMNWACGAQNSFMADKGAPEENIMDCTRYQALLDKYGPDYTSLKERIGHFKGLFD